MGGRAGVGLGWVVGLGKAGVVRLDGGEQWFVAVEVDRVGD